MPRIVVFDHTGQVGGGELALLRLVERIGQEGYNTRVVLFADGPMVGRFGAAGIDVTVVPLASNVNTASRDDVLSPRTLVRSLASAVGLVPQLVRLLRRERAELVVANTLKAAVFTAIAAPLAGCPWVWHLHDRLAADYLPAPLVLAMRSLATIGPRRIVVNSLATLATLPARARRKAVVAYPGLPAAAFEPATPSATAVGGRLGRISPAKGQRELLRAAATVATDHPQVRFRVIGSALFGEDDYAAEVQALPAELGIADRVEFTGWVDDPSAQLRALTLLVHASPVPEPFGQVVVEAMAAGVPVLGTDAGGVPEILEPDGGATTDGESWRVTGLGALVRPGDSDALAQAMRWALDHQNERGSMAARARDLAWSRFSIEATTRVVAAAWADALARRSR